MSLYRDGLGADRIGRPRIAPVTQKRYVAFCMKNFALIGAAGYIAPRHLRAIKDTGNELVAAYDLFDSVGILDSFFPHASFFTGQASFCSHLKELAGTDGKVDIVSVCSPNHLHQTHIRCGLDAGADVICEKPLVLGPEEIEALRAAEKESGHKISTILQLRLHPSILALKRKIGEGPADKTYDVDLTYITPRGKWYYASWKGDVRKSGGVAANIGVHFYDMLQWVFGSVKQNIVHVASHDRVAGYLELDRARVRYFLSISAECLPPSFSAEGRRTFRNISIDGEEYEFSDGFTELHTESYRQILAGNGFGLDDAMNSVNIISDIRSAVPVGLRGDYHPLAAQSSRAGTPGLQV